MDGTQSPTKVPCSLCPENQSVTDSRNEAAAATRNSLRALVILSMFTTFFPFDSPRVAARMSRRVSRAVSVSRLDHALPIGPQVELHVQALEQLEDAAELAMQEE